MRSIVVTPTYNERENIEEFVQRVRHHAPGTHILIVDDSSPDGTGEVADGFTRQYPDEVFVLHRAEKQGLGRAYVAGFRQVIERGYEIIAQMDADLSHDPVYLPAMLEKIAECDLVLGSRYTRGINVVNWDLKRLILSKAANRYVQLVTGMAATDATGGFKCWRREALSSIGLNSIVSNGYVFQVETTFRAMQGGFRVQEIPIIFYERNLGKSKMDLRIIFEALWNVWKLRLRRGH
jgi:dolichol-phosphate mannosyltransferase